MGQSGRGSQLCKEVVSATGDEWSVIRSGGKFLLVGTVNQVRALSASLDCLISGAGGLLRVMRRSRPRLGRALGVGRTVGMCVVNSIALLALVRSGRGKWVHDNVLENCDEHQVETCAFVEKGDGGAETHHRCHSGNGYNLNLVAHLRTYVMLKKRDASTLSMLTSRAKAWQLRQGVSDHCFANYAPMSVMLAYCESPNETCAIDMLASDTMSKTVRRLGSGPMAATPFEGLWHAWTEQGLVGVRRHLSLNGRGVGQ